jgi:hypothetical protein
MQVDRTKRFYAGIGGRTIPRSIAEEMTKLGSHFEAKGFTLRSGNASGSDQAFALGVEEAAQIWLPWSHFEKDFRISKPKHTYMTISTFDQEATSSASIFHPLGDMLTGDSRKFMARNYRQVIGRQEPNCEFVLCYTFDGKIQGGTGQAMRIANHHKIPIINMFEFDTAKKVIDHLNIWHGI